MSDIVDPEAAVRSYLLSLRDPSALVDQEAIEALTREAEQTTDPIEQLRLLTRLERAKAVDPAHFEHQFIRCAKQWADANDVSVAAFRSLGVPDATLRAAGLMAGAGRGAAPRTPRRASGSSGRAPAVPSEQIKAHVLGLSGTFTMSAVVEAVRGSEITVRKAIGELVDAGRVRNLGPDPHHHGRGRAPLRYEIVA
jgi:hypothetical protein